MSASTRRPPRPAALPMALALLAPGFAVSACGGPNETLNPVPQQGPDASGAPTGAADAADVGVGGESDGSLDRSSASLDAPSDAADARPADGASPASDAAAATDVGPHEAPDGRSPFLLPWPLREQHDVTIARPAVGNSFGEFQLFGDGPYLHSGIDIRGKAGDKVLVVADGSIWATHGFGQDGCEMASDCRLYVAAADQRYIYYYAHLALKAQSEELTSEVRDKILAAWTAADVPTTDIVVRQGTDLRAGQVLAAIDAFAGGEWDHLHFGILDRAADFDAINPLAMLNPEVGSQIIVDDEPPTISSIAFVRDGADAARVEPAGACQESPERSASPRR